MASAASTPEGVLRRYWGFSSFRSCQQGVVEAVLQGADNLVVMATGGGKSLCYQVPPLVLGKPAIVVSPLISLMEDQVMALNAKGISACFLGSAQSSAQVTADAWRGRYQFVYITPELAANAIDRLRELKASAGLALIAVDEAHCISEWGFDFRTEYRYLYRLREALPDVPFMALTATATPKVRDDITANLRLKPDARCWIMSFERPNLHFSVQRKQPRVAANFGALLAAAERGEAQPTIVYTLTKREAQDLAAELGAQPGLQRRVASYHGDLTIQQRRDVHAAFMNDDLTVVVATVAFGMGIDKGNVRHIYHYGAPASLEAYYQQAGRAGRDGVQSSCVLLWSATDATTNAFIKSRDGHSAEASAQRDVGSDAITAYIHAPACRHRAMVEYFCPGSWTAARCTGGCDNCAAAAAGGSMERDLAGEARLLLATVQRLREMGVGTAIQLLRGSRAQKMKPWMFDITAPDGTKLHGAGAQRSEAWWKALAGMLTGKGFIANHTKAPSGYGQRAYAVVCITDQGAAFLRLRDRLVMQLSGEMLAQEKEALRAAQAAAEAKAAADALAAQRNAHQAEEQQLFKALLDVRRTAATAAGVAPSQLCSDFTLWEMVRARPGQRAALAACQGCSEHFVRSYGKAFVDAIVSFCAGSQLLDVQDAQQLLSQTQQPGGSQAARGRSSLPLDGAACSQAAACLSQPKGAALEAYQRFQAQGEDVSSIASTGRAKPINRMTVVGYLADAGGSGMLLDWGRATAEAALAEDAAPAIAEAIIAYGAQGLGGVKRSLPSAEYGHIKLVAAMMNSRQHWFSGGGGVAPGGGSQQGAPAPAATAAENVPANGAAAGGAAEPDAKRQRLSSAGGSARASQAQPQVERAAVAAWLASRGGASGPQLVSHFFGGTPGDGSSAARRQLLSVLAAMCDDFELVRRGTSAATSSAIDLSDPAVTFLLL